MKTSAFDPNDDRLTAYALGELDASQREDLEQLLLASPELRQELAGLQGLAISLRAELSVEPLPSLTIEQHQALRDQANVVAPAVSPGLASTHVVFADDPHRRRIRRREIVGVGVAVGVAVSIGIWGYSRSENRLTPAEPYLKLTANTPTSTVTFNVDSNGNRAQGLATVELETEERVRLLSEFTDESAPTHEATRFIRRESLQDLAPETRVKRNEIQFSTPGILFTDSGAAVLGISPNVEHAWPEYRTNESYRALAENAFLTPAQQPLSTFSIDVDSASYANIRRFLTQGQLPPAEAVRVEEMINYFHYDYPRPNEGEPFSVTADAAPCPWQRGHYLARIGLQARTIDKAKRPPTNLVFLLDVSGSMQAPNKLPLVKQAMTMLVEELNERDRIAIVTYAGDAGVKLGLDPRLTTKSGSCSRSKPCRRAVQLMARPGSTWPMKKPCGTSTVREKTA